MTNTPSLPSSSRLRTKIKLHIKLFQLSSVERNSYHRYFQIAIVIRRYKLIQATIAVGREDDFARIRVLILAGSTSTCVVLRPGGSPVDLRLNYRPSATAANVFCCCCCCCTEQHLFRTAGRKRVHLFAEQRIGADNRLLTAVFVLYDNIALASNNIDDNVVIVLLELTITSAAVAAAAVVVFVIVVVIKLVVGLFEKVRIEETAFLSLVRVVQLTNAATTTVGAGVAAVTLG